MDEILKLMLYRPSPSLKFTITLSLRWQWVTTYNRATKRTSISSGITRHSSPYWISWRTSGLISSNWSLSGIHLGPSQQSFECYPKYSVPPKQLLLTKLSTVQIHILLQYNTTLYEKLSWNWIVSGYITKQNQHTNKTKK